MRKLVMLMILYIYNCKKLTCMPDDISMECLLELTVFLVGVADSRWNSYLKSLENLKALGT